MNILKNKIFELSVYFLEEVAALDSTVKISCAQIKIEKYIVRILF